MSTYDYVVVGGGTAGLTVASRLTEDPEITVLVVEAGPDNTGDSLVLTPGLVGAQFGQEKYDWNFQSTSQPNLHGRIISQPRGRQLGGSSALNFMMTLYPSRTNIDAWGKLGNKGWNYDALEPYFLKSSKSHRPSDATKQLLGLNEYHDDTLSGDGPVHVSFGQGYMPEINGTWMKTFSNLGLKMTADPRTGKALGGFQNPATIDPTNNTRSYAVPAYLGPKVRERSNLTVLTKTTVEKICMEKRGNDHVATGVIIRTSEGLSNIQVSREVILAAGALQSPQILELSGIGNGKILQENKIEVIIDNSNVGENLQDHAMVCQSFEVADGIPSGDVIRDPNVLGALVEMYAKQGGAGPLGQSSISVAYAPLADSGGIMSVENTAALLESHGSSLGALQPKELELLQEMVKRPEEPLIEYLLFPAQITVTQNPANFAEAVIPSRPENYVSVLTILNHPFSRGSVHIQSADVDAKPEWEPSYLSHPLDLEILARNVQFVEKIVGTEPFKGSFKADGLRHPNIIGDSLENAREIVRQAQLSVFHLSGSCAMRPRDQGGVVDERLMVYGTTNVRIVDASVFPLEPLGNIQSTVYAVAEKAADIIKEDRKTRA